MYTLPPLVRLKARSIGKLFRQFCKRCVLLGPFIVNRLEMFAKQRKQPRQLFVVCFAQIITRSKNAL